MTVLDLVRHAHAVWTPDEQRPLSPRGRRDAERLAGVLASCPIDAIYASPYRRARETVAPLARRLGLPVRVEADLRERRLGAEPVADFLAAVQALWADPQWAWPGGESNAAAQRRGVALLRRLRARHPGEHVVLGTHGNLLALIVQHVDPGVDFAFWRALTMPDVYRLTWEAAGPVGYRRIRVDGVET
jgi:2,3-bisphosphoglycerate-dependent phosphoglycerate mutase